MTGLPFVFACWVANRELPKEFLSAFNSALRHGVEHRSESIIERDLPNASAMVDYVNHRISYDFDERKRQALGLFLQLSSNS
jgi:chorismate dehydratase